MPNESADVALLAIGAGVEQLGFIRAAQRLGYRVIAVDGDPACAGASVADLFVAVDIADAEAVLEVARTHRIGAVIPAPIGRFLTTVGAVNDALGLRGPSRAAASVLVDKRRFHEHARKLGLPRPRQSLATSMDALFKAKRELGGAIVIKPRHGAGSRGVRVAEPAMSDDALRAAYAGHDFSGDDLLAEDFVSGPELGVDFVVRGSRIVFLLAREKRVTPIPLRVVTGYRAPAEVPERLTVDLALLVESLQVRDGVFNADVVLGTDGPVILEATARPSGLLMTERFVPLVARVPYVEQIIELVARGEFPEAREAFGAAALAFLPLPAGEVTRVDPAGIDPCVVLYAKAGDVLRPVIDGAALLARGHVMVTGPTPEQALAMADAIAERARAAISIRDTEVA